MTAASSPVRIFALPNLVSRDCNQALSRHLTLGTLEGGIARFDQIVSNALRTAKLALAPLLWRWREPKGACMPTTPPRSETRPEGDRIAKLLARAGVASRREIERMIAEGRVALDGKVLGRPPATILPNLKGVTVDGKPVTAAEPTRLFAFHKPTGLITAESDPTGRPTIYTALRKRPAGECRAGDADRAARSQHRRAAAAYQ